MAIKINENSYLLFSELINVEGYEFWDFPDFPDILPQTDDIFITIGKERNLSNEIVNSSEEIRIDLLSLRIYGTTQLWWIIALRNGFELMPNSLKLGTTIIVPSPRYVFQEIIPKARG